MPAMLRDNAFRFGSVLLLLICGTNTSAQEDPKDIIAVQVRSQGYECASPVSATKDSADSQPNEEAWVLKCENATYKVRFVPDMAAQIELID